MRTSRFTEEQIVGILQEHAAGAKTGELVRRDGISRETFYKWRRKYGGLKVDEAKRLRALEEENRKMRYTPGLRLLITSMLCIGCTTVGSHDRVREAARSDPLVALATYIATSEGNQRYAVSTKIYCGHSEGCPAGDSVWGASTLQALFAALNATAAPENNLRALLMLRKADMVLAFGPLDEVGPDSGTLIVRYEYQGGARVDRAHLHRSVDSWQVDRIETIVVGTWVDTLLRVR